MRLVTDSSDSNENLHRDQCNTLDSNFVCLLHIALKLIYKTMELSN